MLEKIEHYLRPWINRTLHELFQEFGHVIESIYGFNESYCNFP